MVNKINIASVIFCEHLNFDTILCIFYCIINYRTKRKNEIINKHHDGNKQKTAFNFER